MADTGEPEKVNLQDAIKKLSHESHSIIYKSLIQIRGLCNKTEGIKEFSAKGGIQPLLLLLEKPKLCDITLSILANCLLEEAVRDKVVSCNGISPIVRVFRCLASESIQNRACRAIANLAISPKAAHFLHRQNVIPLIIKFLSETKLPNGHQTAVRAIRLLSCGYLYKNKILENEGAFHVSNLLKSEDVQTITYTLKTLASLTEYCTIECAQQVHRSGTLPTIIELCNVTDTNNKANALMTVINLCSQSVIRPELGNAGVVPLLIKSIEQQDTVCRSSTFFGLVTALCLCCREAVNRVRIRDNDGLKTMLYLVKNEGSKFIQERIICSLLAFRFDEASLDVLLELGLVETLAEQLTEFIAANEQEHLLRDKSVEKDVTEINFEKSSILKSNERIEINKLDDGNDDETSQAVDRKKVFCIHSPSYQQVQNEQIDVGGVITAPIDSYSYVNNYKDVPSPSSVISYCMSPDQNPPEWSYPSSPCYSPSASILWSPTTVDSRCSSPSSSYSSRGSSPIRATSPTECYSPVCQDFSDAEDASSSKSIDKTPDSTPRKFIRKTKRRASEPCSRAQSPGSDSGTSRCDSNLVQSPSKKHKYIIPTPKEEETVGGQIIQLLSHISQMDKNSVALATKNCLRSIMEYMTRLPEPSLRAERILIRLVKNYNCFDALISFGIIGLINEHLPLKHETKVCRSCKKLQNTRKKILNSLSLVSESGYGIGVLSHVLLTGQQSEIATCILTIPHLVKGHYQLRKLLCDCNGLKHLIQQFNDQNSVEAVESVSILCKNFFSAPKVNSCRNAKLDSSLRICCYQTSCADIQFLLDEETASPVLANRKRLASKSPFFSAMLEGSFLESSLSQINLPGVSSPALTVVLHHLYGCNTTCPEFQSISSDVKLELITLCDRFLLSGLAECIHEELVADLRPELVQTVYAHARRYGWFDLSQAVLKYILTGDMSNMQRYQCFQDIRLKRSVAEVFIGDVQETITNKILEIHSNAAN